jgi:hypothetical protein
MSGKKRTSKGTVASSPFEKKEVHLLSEELRNSVKGGKSDAGKKKEKKA